jgi:glycosyltransferase involved in cell wall biosynthesis
MRIAYVSVDPGVPVFGRKGCSVHVQEVVRALLKKGHEVDIFTSRVGGDTPPDFEDVRVHALTKIPKGEPAARERASLAANTELRARLEREGPFDMVYERYSLWSFAGMKHASENEIPGLLEVNAPLIEEQKNHRDLVDVAGAVRVAERAFGKATALLPVSNEVAEYLREWPSARGRIHTVPNGVNTSRFPKDLAPSLPDDAFTVGFVGTLKPWHGLHVLTEAFALMHERDGNVRLLVVGDGPEREKMEEELAWCGLSGFAHFTGPVGPEEVPGLLASMDVATAPYPARDDFYFSPLKVYEYMAASLPVVASRVGQLGDLIAPGENGLLVEPGDAEALADALDVLRKNGALRARMGEEARDTVVRDHTWDSVAGRILEIAGAARTAEARA